jgi:hypothetical protein
LALDSVGADLEADFDVDLGAALGADFVVADPPDDAAPEDAGAPPYAPARAEQVGQAPHPCAFWTLVATAIWAALEALSAVDA